MKVYTKTGDEGQTSLLSRERVSKDHVRVDAYGTVDEANAAMGLAKALTGQDWAAALIDRIQTELIALNADLATDAAASGQEPRIAKSHVAGLEAIIDSLEEKRIPQRYFVNSGGTPAAAALDLARTVVRRAERRAVTLLRSGEVSRPVLLYLNRLSDLLFVLARRLEQEAIIAAATRQVMAALPGGNFILQQEENTMLAKAKQMMAAAEEKAREIGVPVVIAVVDEGGNLVAQQRMDGALLASISLSLDKAYSALALKMSTEEAAALAVPGESLFGLNTANGGRLIVFGGGLPIVKNGQVIGGIGVSGGSVEQDIAVARAGMAVY
ncbi:cob(I)yrinic acid a,c-diamide adenosyltransferase [Acetonema longum]|uniref:Corrinoid adenosyltransferase n=1 Tax=Acetonema longum DSM 6540 TaxID=1009370 RepID=F7NH14_9FIRM|nr:cob(I)yrinic acid a,c-diamide adenosyltransferase [Acetonema longum]EGO64745.1 ATP/cobalamin adenosyltransferase [Acetonema longum DSM 6540]